MAHLLDDPPFWQRRGVFFNPDQLGSGWSGHCQMPTPLVMEDGRLRIFFCSRDRANCSHVLWVDVENEAPWRTIAVAREPILSPGVPGLYDAAGVMPSSVLRLVDRLVMYTIGWTVRADVAYHNAIGLCESFDGGVTWKKAVPGPVLAQNAYEPYFCGTSEVVADESGYVMYYMSASEWRMVDGKPEPRYNIRRAVSEDGIQWSMQNPVAIDYLNDEEGGIARATLGGSREGRKWMWFCHRGIHGYRSDRAAGYKIGFAASPDGVIWRRAPPGSVFTDEAGPEAFDANMECYPFVHETEDGAVLFYNGDGFGRTGIGYAVRP